MSGEQDAGKHGVQPATHAPSTASPAPVSAPGKQTQVPADVDGTASAGPRGFGWGIPGLPAARGKQPLDLELREPDHVSEAIDKFRIALDANDAEGAHYAWSFAPPKDKRAFGASSTVNRDLVKIVNVIGPMTIHIMAEAGLDFDGRADLIDLILKVGFPHWFDGLARRGGTILVTFLDQLPARDQLDAAALKKLDRIMRGTNALAIARPLFERIYVPLADGTYNANRVRTTAWQTEQIQRLYKTLSTHLPVAHVRAVRSFHLGTEKNEGGAWKKLRNAWWNTNGYVVLPASEVAEGGGRQHRMTGGGRAHADPTTKKGAGQGAMDKFDVGALHEVGHAIGDALGGHAFARTHKFVDWQTSMAPDAWSKGLWGDDAKLSAHAGRKDPDRTITAQDARLYMAQDLGGNAVLSPGWEVDDFEEALLKQYGDQPLTKYWKEWRDKDKSKAYLFSGNANYGNDGRVYVFLSRGGSGLSSYKQEAHKQRVSWYSIASPHEWWAEQYAHFYRTGKTGDGIDPGTAQKLADLDTQDPTANQAPKPAGDSPGEDYDADSGSEQPLPFPW